MSGRRGPGVGDFKGFYSTSSAGKKKRKEFKKTHDTIQVRVPLGTKERIKATGYSQQDFLAECIKAWLHNHEEKEE